MKSGKMAKVYRNILKYLVITVAAAAYGAGISLFIDPNNLAPGGVSGLSIVVNRLIPVETGTIYLIINIPIRKENLRGGEV